MTPIQRASFVHLATDDEQKTQAPSAHPLLPTNKYATIHSYEDSKKVDALKDVTLDPNLIQDGRDQLAHGLHLWTIVAQRAKAKGEYGFSSTAGNFYDKILAPAYGHLNLEDKGIAPMSRETWIKQAWNEAPNYKIEDAYNSNLYHAWKHGWNSSMAEIARTADRITTMVGHPFDSIVAQYQKEKAFRAQSDLAREIELKHPNADPIAAISIRGASEADKQKTYDWLARVKQIDSQLSAQKESDKITGTGIIGRGARYQDAHRQFWADAIPTHKGFLNSVTSSVAEMAGEAPIMAAMELTGGAAGAAPGVGNLTEALSKIPQGKRVLGYLLAGGSGLAFGTATARQDDPNKKWRDAIGFAVFHGLFDVGGTGLKKFKDVITNSRLRNAAQAEEERLALSQQDLRPMNQVEMYDAHKTEVANNIAAVGLPGQRSIFISALHFVAEQQKANFEGYHQKAEALMKEDPAKWSPVLSAAKYIRGIMGDRPLETLTPEEHDYLNTRIGRLTADAAGEINSRVHMLEVHEAKAAEMAKTPSAKHTLEFFVNRVKERLAKSNSLGLVSPEQIQKAAEKDLADALAKAAKTAETEAGTPKGVKAVGADARRRDVDVRTRRTTNAKGEPSASVKVESYLTRLAQYKKTAKDAGKTLAEFFQDMDPQDFVKDLTDHFYPKALKNAKVYFEGQTTREGMQNPNFLAFMRNYRDQMPHEFAEALDNHLVDTMKAQKYLNPRNQIEPQLSYYAKAMHNHVDNFLGSGRWPNEYNIFRTSNETIFRTTRYQEELLTERMLGEQQNLVTMFSNDPAGMKQALLIHKKLSDLRLKEFRSANIKDKSQHKIQALNEQITQHQKAAAKETGFNVRTWRF